MGQVNYSQKNKVVFLDQRQDNFRQADQVEPRQVTSLGRLGIIVLVGSLVLLAVGLPIKDSLSQYRSQETELKAVKAEYQQAQQRHLELNEALKRLDDPEYLAEIARKDYYYSKPGEIIFNLEGLQEDSVIESN